MRKDKEKAYILRKEGKSYREISQVLGVPKSTLSCWLKNEAWSREIGERLASTESFEHPAKLKLMVEGNKKRWKLLHEQYRQAAIKEFKKLKKEPLFLAGLMLYWGEGEKQSKSSVVRLANSDPALLRIFYLFLRRVIKVPEDKIWAWLLLYPDLVDSVQKSFWSKSIGFSTDKFKKSIYIKGKHPTKRLSYGVCTIFVQSRELKEKILKWIEMANDYLRASS